MSKLTFSGHETFICKQFWLKKGYDYLKKGKGFSDSKSVVELGVGKNMVSAISFWLKAFGLTTNAHAINPLAETIFNKENGYDPFLEDIGTIWLLHYFLVKTSRSSIYNIVFNNFRRHRFDEFTKEHLLNYLNNVCDQERQTISQKTLENDINVFFKTYEKPDTLSKVEIEDTFTGLLQDLGLVQRYRTDETKQVWYRIPNSTRIDLPHQIVLYAILDRLDDLTKSHVISFKELQQDQNSPGIVFALSDEGMMNKIDKIIQQHSKDVTFTQDAGVQVLQFRSGTKLNKQQVLTDFYK